MVFFGSSPPVKSVGRVTIIRVVSLFLLIFICSYAFADRKPHVLFVVSKSSADYVEVLNGVQERLEAQSPGAYEFTARFRAPRLNLKPDLAKADFVVSIGTAAADLAFSHQPKVPIISVLITENAFSVLAKKYYGSIEDAFAAQVSSVCLDQPVTRSIELAKLVIPKVSKVGVMLGPASISRAAALGKYIVDTDLHPQFVNIDTKDNPILKIEPVLSRSDVFIPISDSRLINIATAKWILHLSYRHKVPVIAFSKSYLKAGALAAIYSSPVDVARDTVDWFANSRASTAGGLYKPTHYSLNFNKSVAANLQIELKPDQFYRDYLSKETR
jgi:ABC-type uncharacterized transport system substrate-binding protein